MKNRPLKTSTVLPSSVLLDSNGPTNPPHPWTRRQNHHLETMTVLYSLLPICFIVFLLTMFSNPFLSFMNAPQHVIFNVYILQAQWKDFLSLRRNICLYMISVIIYIRLMYTVCILCSLKRTVCITLDILIH